jgi:hypothetical protein
VIVHTARTRTKKWRALFERRQDAALLATIAAMTTVVTLEKTRKPGMWS